MNSHGRYRRFICAAGLAFAAAPVMTGCGRETPPRAAVPLPEAARCTLCGMVVANYEGSKAEVFLRGVEHPVFFCSARDAFTFVLQPENARRLEVFYLQNAALGETPENVARSFLDVKKAVLVVASRREGVMGPEPLAFDSEEKAREFVRTMGGRVVHFAAVTLESLS